MSASETRKCSNMSTAQNVPGAAVVVPPPTPSLPTTNLPPTPTKTLTMIPPTGTLRKLLPIAAFLVAFATVMTLLLIYMDNTATRHHQFKLNMTQDYELLSISQDNPQLIAYIREVHLTPAVEPNHKPLESSNVTPDDTVYVLKLLNNKKGGFFIESGAYNDGKTSKTEYLERQMAWRGLLIQPDPRNYFNLKRHNRARSQAVHACLSPTPYPKEVTFHQEEERDGVKINSIPSNSLEDQDCFNTRVKCFPLYSLMLAMNVTAIDYLSLEAAGAELQVLETVPFEAVRIEVIEVLLGVGGDFERETIKAFLAQKGYGFRESFGGGYVFLLEHAKV